MQMTGWDIAILVIAAYVAIMLLVRLMRKRSAVIEATFRKKLEEEKVRLAEEAEREKEEERLRRLRKTVQSMTNDE